MKFINKTSILHWLKPELKNITSAANQQRQKKMRMGHEGLIKGLFKLNKDFQWSPKLQI